MHHHATSRMTRRTSVLVPIRTSPRTLVPTRSSPRIQKSQFHTESIGKPSTALNIILPNRRTERLRKSRTVYSPAVLPTRKNRARQSKPQEGNDGDPNPYRLLEGRIRGHVKHMKYYEAFLEAYEAEGWRRASREKLKPTRELLIARAKLLKAKRGIVTTLQELDAIKQKDPQIPYLKELEAIPSDDETSPVDAHQIHCSRCASTVTTVDNDILLCDYEGCFRAYHQQCQAVVVRTEEIPEGDEPWFCPSCLAIFNSLKCINNALGTTYEKITDVFPNLASEEETEKDENSVERVPDMDNEEEDEDFELGEDGDKMSSSTSDSDKDEDNSDSGDGDVSEDGVSDDELRHLKKDDVIDPNRRTTRSVGTTNRSLARPNVVGSRVAKVDTATNDNVFGVVVEECDESDSDENKQTTKWRVVYYDNTVDILDYEAVMNARELALGQPDSDDSGINDKLILRSKRKRKHVDYRELNDIMFGGKEDSDEETEGFNHEHDLLVDDDEEYQHNASDIEDEEVSTIPQQSAQLPLRREPDDEVDVYASKRTRRVIDYRAMHEGVVSY